VFKARNYHVYSGGWSLGRYPAHLFALFHSSCWYPYGSNYVTDYAHPVLDDILEGSWTTMDMDDIRDIVRNATKYIVENCVSIYLWSYVSYFAWRKELVGIVNDKGSGCVNDLTFLNAYRSNNSSALVRLACVSAWDALNVLYSQWYFEYALLDRVYSGLIAVNPYDSATDLPWGAQDWNVSSWVDPRDSNTKTCVTYWLNKGQGCAEPATGNYVGRFNATDYEFTAWYNYAFDTLGSGAASWTSTT
jgi:hypothetical protein